MTGESAFSHCSGVARPSPPNDRAAWHSCRSARKSATKSKTDLLPSRSSVSVASCITISACTS
eukprot:3003677-Prymnesium_polylepis.1